MHPSKDLSSPPGPPPGPALKPVVPYLSHRPMSPLLLPAGRRGAISHELKQNKLLFASRSAQDDSREDECLEPGMGCLMCYGHLKNDTSNHNNNDAEMAILARNPARAMSFGDIPGSTVDFRGYSINQPLFGGTYDAPAKLAQDSLEGDTLLDDDPVSPKTTHQTTDSLLQRFANDYRRDYETAYATGTTSPLLSRPRFAAQTTIDHSSSAAAFIPPPSLNTSILAWNLPIGESVDPAYRFPPSNPSLWTPLAQTSAVSIITPALLAGSEMIDSWNDQAKDWALNIDKQSASATSHRSSSSRIISGDPLQQIRLRNLKASSSSSPLGPVAQKEGDVSGYLDFGSSVIGESSTSGAARMRDSSGTSTGTGTDSYRDTSSGSYMPSSPPVPGPTWRRTSRDGVGAPPHQSHTYDPTAPEWRRGSAARASYSYFPPGIISTSVAGPAPANIDEIFRQRPLATRRPFSPANYVIGGPHPGAAFVRPDGTLTSNALITSSTMPSLLQHPSRYGGLTGAIPGPLDDPLNNDKNTCLWLEGMPSTTTYLELTTSIRNCGRIYSTYINRPVGHHTTSAAKLAFFTRAGAERLYMQALREEFKVRDQRVFVRWNRNAYAENERKGATRILLIRGPVKWVNEKTLTDYFTTLFWSNICSITTVPLSIAASWVGSDWLENPSGMANLPEDYREFAAMRWEFASFHSQATSAKAAIESETAFGGLIKVNFLPDPCDFTG